MPFHLLLCITRCGILIVVSQPPSFENQLLLSGMVYRPFFFITWFLSYLRLFSGLHYVPDTGIVFWKSCQVFSLSPHTDESYLFKMIACQGILYGKPHAYCGSLTLAIHLCVLHEGRQFRTVKHINKLLCFINVATCFRFLLSHHQVAVKSIEDFLQ